MLSSRVGAQHLRQASLSHPRLDPHVEVITDALQRHGRRQEIDLRPLVCRDQESPEEVHGHARHVADLFPSHACGQQALIPTPSLHQRRRRGHPQAPQRTRVVDSKWVNAPLTRDCLGPSVPPHHSDGGWRTWRLDCHQRSDVRFPLDAHAQHAGSCVHAGVQIWDAKGQALHAALHAAFTRHCSVTA